MREAALSIIVEDVENLLPNNALLLLFGDTGRAAAMDEDSPDGGSRGGAEEDEAAAPRLADPFLMLPSKDDFPPYCCFT